MCILIAKSASARKMTKKEIQNSSSNNPDGFGMAWVNKKGKIKTLHTFLVDDIIKQNNRLPDNTPILYHFRIATHGSINIKNCHPFLSADKSIAFGHNGILSIQNEEDKTDSETAFNRLFVPVIKAYGNGVDLDLAVDTIIRDNKFAFLFKDGSIKTYGNFIEDNGLLFSNKTYLYDNTWVRGYYLDDLTKTTNSIASVMPTPRDDYYDMYEQEYVDAEREMDRLASEEEYLDYEFMYDFIRDYSLMYPSLRWEDYEDMFDRIKRQNGFEY